jgi:hypothetical protein
MEDIYNMADRNVEETSTDLKKSVEGNILALNAVHDVLSKQTGIMEAMSGYFAKMVANQDTITKAEQEKEEIKKGEEAMSSLAKALMEFGFVTKDMIAKDMSKPLEGGNDTIEKPHKIASAPGGGEGVPSGQGQKQQEVIQAATEEKDAKEELKEKFAEGTGKGKDEDKDEEREFPALENLKKSIAKLEAEKDALSKSMDAQIKKQVEDNLRRFGIREERRTFSPTPKSLDSLGAEGAIKKGETVEKVDLADLSYTDLRKLQMLSEADELPEEYKKLIS